MNCKKCRADLPDGAIFCHICGTRQEPERRHRVRGNGQGCVYKRGQTWTAIITDKYVALPDGTKRRISRSKGGFKTKKEAVAYLPTLAMQAPKAQKSAATLAEIYARWEPTHRAGKSTMDCYHAAWKYFAAIKNQKMADIDIDDLQECMDSCPKGKRTKENMKALCGLLYKYAIPRNIVSLDMGHYLIITADPHGEKDALPLDAVEKLRNAVGSVPYADYVVAQCYLRSAVHKQLFQQRT